MTKADPVQLAAAMGQILDRLGYLRDAAEEQGLSDLLAAALSQAGMDAG